MRNVGGKRNQIQIIILGAIALLGIAARADEEVRCSVTAKIKEGSLSLGDSVGRISPWDNTKLLWFSTQPLTFIFKVENPAVNGGCPTNVASHRGEMVSQLGDSFLCLLPNDTALPEREGDIYPCVDARGLDLTGVEFSEGSLPLEPPPAE